MSSAIEWLYGDGLIPYSLAVNAMEEMVEGIISGVKPETVWMLEHEGCYTAGTSAHESELLSNHLPVYKTGRGGRYTYHGPGQLICYLMLDLKKRGGQPDIRSYIKYLESTIISILSEFGINGFTVDGRTGVWVKSKNHISGEAKIAAIGVRVRKWVTYHGFSINVSPDLSCFDGIVPCGISSYGVTSLSAEGVLANVADVKSVCHRLISTG